MDERETIRELYRRYWEAMVAGDAETLRAMMAEDHHLRHMTGAVQTREEFLEGQRRGTFRYYEVQHDSIEVSLAGNTAVMTGRSRVLAAVYGGGKHSWRLRGDFRLRKEKSVWKLTESSASTY